MITCPQCQTSNPPSARFCMNCGSFLPLAAKPAADTRPPANLPPSAAGFTLPSEAAQQTTLPAADMARSGYLRYAKPTGQTGQLDATPTAAYTPPSTPPPTASQSQAALWMAQSSQPTGYYYPPPPTLQPVGSEQHSFGLYISAAVIALLVVLAAAWFLLWGLPSATNGAATRGGGSLAPTPAAPGGNPPAQGNGAPNLAACGAAQPTPTDAEQQAVVAAINASNEDQITALKSLNSDVLKNHTIGTELNNQIQDLQALQGQGVYEDARMECISFVSVHVTSATAATAMTVETWSGTIYDQKTNSQLGTEPANTMHETYTLVKQNGQWFVSNVVIVGQPNGQPGQPTPPDNSQLLGLQIADCRL